MVQKLFQNCFNFKKYKFTSTGKCVDFHKFTLKMRFSTIYCRQVCCYDAAGKNYNFKIGKIKFKKDKFLVLMLKSKL